jgi:DNA-binding transcriptional LysR family regulator
LRRLVDRWLANPSPTAPNTVQDAWDAPTAITLAVAGAGMAVLPGPLPPLPAGAVALPLRNSPSLDLSLAWHPANDPTIRPIVAALRPQLS